MKPSGDGFAGPRPVPPEGETPRMLAEERRNRILEVLRDRRFVSVNDLHDELRVSRETIRRDINRLAAESRLTKTHGGAQSMNREEPAFESRMAVNLAAKQAIGARAAQMVGDGATVIVDSGTTCLCAAEALMERRGLTVYTNDIQVAGKLADRNDNRVYLLGGELVAGEGATMGRDTTAMLANYFADFAFIGISSITEDGALSDYTREAAALREAMIGQARAAVLLGDRDKFGWAAGVRVGGTDKVRCLITDRKPAAGIAQAFKDRGVEVIVAKG